MSEKRNTLVFDRVASDSVEGITEILFIVALLFFLVNITLGFLNALTTGALPAWQMFSHLHAAALGWFTLSVFGIAFCVFTGTRDVSNTHVRRIRFLGYLAILAITGYIASFAIGYSQNILMLLPVFGASVLIILWVATIYAFSQVRHQPVVTMVHIFTATSLLVASIGGTMGVMVGLNRATGVGIADVGAHAPVMLFYILGIASVVVEWFVAQDGHGRWSWPGLAQAFALVVAGLIPPIAISLDIMMLMPIMLLGLILFFVLFLGRVGWKALYTNPLEPGVRAWTFFGTVWLILTVVMFPAEIAIEPPDWFLPVVAHVGFVGMTSNLLFGVLSDRTREARRLHEWAEPGAMWLLNIGVLAFIALKIAMDTRYGAYIMGLGALLGVVLMLYRLLE